ncbi:hypothetical protein [Kingella bonacorsii]|uniref:Uncharacterized protein n=1 Tax=Kingella bonacorsii TaxID=2796361 RepID=A0ABS1BNY6_9NEIS|nr:hypothetical protein [Kingella bonacorsii]MBK0395021.1 hypothetical protein [Kingella bonacorsii]
MRELVSSLSGCRWQLELSLNPSIGSLKKQRRHYLLNGWSNGVNNFQAAYRRRIRQPEKVEWKVEQACE